MIGYESNGLQYDVLVLIPDLKDRNWPNKIIFNIEVTQNNKLSTVIIRPQLRHDYGLPAYRNNRDWNLWYSIWCFGPFPYFIRQKLTKLRQFTFFNNNNNKLTVVVSQPWLRHDYVLPAYRNGRKRKRLYSIRCFIPYPGFIGQKLAK